MASLDTSEAWNAYHDRFGYSPTDALQLHKFSKSSAGKHVDTLSFKDAQTIFKLNKGKGKIDTNNTNNNSKKKRNSTLMKKRKSTSKPNTPNTPNSPALTPEFINRNSSHRNSKSTKPTLQKRKSKSRSKSPNSPNKPPHLKRVSSTNSSSHTSQLSPPTKHKKTSSKHKKNASNISKYKKRKSKSKKIKKVTNKAREIRSQLNNNPTDPSLDSMLEILRRATLVKKQKKRFEKEQRELAEKAEREHMEKEKELRAKMMEINSNEHTNDLTTTDLTELRDKESKMRKETEDLFKTTISVDGSVHNINPLLGLKNKYSMDSDSSDDDNIILDNTQNSGGVVDRNGNGITLGVIDETVNDNNSNQNISVSVSDMENESVNDDDDDDNISEDGYETPPELFRDDEQWDWTENDIVFNDGSINYGISLQLLHLGLTQGPLFPNSILKWKRLRFKENGPTPRSGHVSAFINDKMVIFGGYCQQMLTDHIFLVDTNDFDMDNASLEVTPISSLEKIHKTYRVGHCGVSLSHNNCLYLFGGWNDQKYINNGLLFNVNSLKLVVEQTKDRILPSARRDHTLCKMGQCLLLFGGWSHDYDGNELWLLGSNWKWQQLSVTGQPPCPRRGHTANVIGSHMFIFGGLYGFTKYLNDLHIYNGDTSEWIQPELVGINRPSPRAWHSCNTVGSQILYFGGTSGRTNFFNDCWVFDTCGYFWFQIECIGNSPLPRCSHTMVKIFEDKTFMTEPFTNECIKINKNGNIENEQLIEKRLTFIMFGGLVANEKQNNEEKKENMDQENGKKKKKKNKKKKSKNKKGSNLLNELKADISKQQKRESKVDKNENENELKSIDVSMEGLNNNGKNKNESESENENNNLSDVFSSDSEREQDMDYVNRIQLSDDLFVLMLQI